VQSVLALYAQENGQGMMFPAENEGGETPPPEPPPSDPAPGADEGGDKPKRGAPHLRVVK
jgi:stringent starvation protein B